MATRSSHELHQWKLRMWMINIITLLFAIGFNGISTVLSQYAVLKFKADPLQIGVLWASFFIVSSFVRPVAGALGDLGYRFRLLILGSLMFTISSATFLFAVDYSHLIVARLFQGLSQGIFMTAAFSLVAYEASTHMEYFEESIAWRSAMLGLGIVIGPALFGYIISFYGFAQAFTLIILIGMSTIVGVTTTIKITKVNEDLGIAGNKGSRAGSSQRMSLTGIFSGFGELLRNPSFRVAIISLFLYSLGYITVTSFLPAFYATKFGKESGIIMGNCLFLIGISSLFPRILSGRLSRRWRCNNIAKLGMLLFWLSLLLLGLHPLPPYVYATSVLIGIGIGFVIPSLQIMALFDVEDSRKGIATGVYITGWDISNLIAPLIFGTVGNVLGYESVIGTAFLPVLAAFFFLILSGRSLRL
ncbi:MAG: MFS transporter [Nitrososphaeria archaeon]